MGSRGSRYYPSAAGENLFRYYPWEMRICFFLFVSRKSKDLVEYVRKTTLCPRAEGAGFFDLPRVYICHIIGMRIFGLRPDLVQKKNTGKSGKNMRTARTAVLGTQRFGKSPSPVLGTQRSDDLSCALRAQLRFR